MTMAMTVTVYTVLLGMLGAVMVVAAVCWAMIWWLEREEHEIDEAKRTARVLVMPDPGAEPTGGEWFRFMHPGEPEEPEE